MSIPSQTTAGSTISGHIRPAGTIISNPNQSQQLTQIRQITPTTGNTSPQPIATQRITTETTPRSTTSVCISQFRSDKHAF